MNETWMPVQVFPLACILISWALRRNGNVKSGTLTTELKYPAIIFGDKYPAITFLYCKKPLGLQSSTCVGPTRTSPDVG